MTQTFKGRSDDLKEIFTELGLPIDLIKIVIEFDKVCLL